MLWSLQQGNQHSRVQNSNQHLLLYESNNNIFTLLIRYVLVCLPVAVTPISPTSTEKAVDVGLLSTSTENNAMVSSVTLYIG